MTNYKSKINMESKYKKGKIYTIRCKTNPEHVYVGSTIQSLRCRFTHHKQCYKCSLYKIINEEFDGNWDNWYIELYENFSCENKEELFKREKEIIREIATINKNGFKTEEIIKQENLAYWKSYRQKNNEKISCECGSKIVKYEISRHLKTKKHTNYIALLK
jgi:hypothetical protein